MNVLTPGRNFGRRSFAIKRTAVLQISIVSSSPPTTRVAYLRPTKMKSFVVFAALMAMAMARPQFDLFNAISSQPAHQGGHRPPFPPQPPRPLHPVPPQRPTHGPVHPVQPVHQQVHQPTPPPIHHQVPQHPAPQQHGHGHEVVVVKETPSNNNGLGGYQYGFEQSDGQAREESAELVNLHQDQHALRVKGSYSWVDPVSKQTYVVHYEADEYGFRPAGAHLPQ